MAVVNAGFLSGAIQGTSADRRGLIWLNHVPALEPYDWGISGAFVDAGGAEFVDPTPPLAYRELNGTMGFIASSTYDWFDNVHAWPSIADVGLVLGPVEVTVELYNAWRREPQPFNSTDLAAVGDGVSLTGLPTLSHIYPPLDGSGETIKILITLDGDPVVDADIEFSWTDGETPVRLILQRLIPFATEQLGILRPEDEFGERLAFLTDVIPRSTDLEQRISLREYPRQTIGYRYKIDEGRVRAELDMLLANTQHRLYGVPMFYFETILTAAASAGALSISVQSTDYSDYRAGGVVAIFVDGGIFDIRGVASFTSTSISLSAGLDNAYPAGSFVVPMRAAFATAVFEGSRFSENLTTLNVTFETQDNEADIADTSAFNSFDGRVLLSDYNFMGKTINQSLARRMTVIDSDTGKKVIASTAKKSRMTTVKRFITKTRQGAWNVRRLIHALRGRQVSFYLPSFRDDFEIAQDMASLSNQMDIFDYGYKVNAFDLDSKLVLRITLNDGTEFVKKVIDAVPSGLNQTVLTLSDNWPSGGVSRTDVQRSEFVELVRFDSDEISFTYKRGSRTVVVEAPVREVLQ